MARLFYFLFGLAILLAIPAASWAQFQTPQQTAPVRIRPQVSRPPTEITPAPIVDDRGTEKSPLVVRALKSNENLAAELNDRSARAFNIIAVLVLAGAVAILGVLQLATFIVTLRTGRLRLGIKWWLGE